MQPSHLDAPLTGARNASDGKDRRIRFADSFKREAIQRWKTSRRSAREISRELGISAATLYAWGREARIGGSGTAAALYLRGMEKELSRLNEENAKYRKQCEILKKTLGILAELPEAGPSRIKRPSASGLINFTPAL